MKVLSLFYVKRNLSLSKELFGNEIIIGGASTVPTKFHTYLCNPKSYVKFLDLTTASLTAIMTISRSPCPRLECLLMI